MSEPEYKAPQPIKSLTVLPNSGKIDQLKKELADAPARKPAEPAAAPADHPLTEKIVDAIRTVYDPELPVNIYDLGLIYDIDVDPETSAVYVQMTLTAPGCPVAGTLPGEVQRKIESVPGVAQAVVELVWDPPWTKDRISEAAMLDLGL